MFEIGDNQPLSVLEKVAAFFTLTDPDLLIHCHAAKRQEVVHEFFMLCAMGLLFLVVWVTTMTAVGIAWLRAAPVSILIVAIILLFDVRMTASDTDPRGILMSGPMSKSFVGRVVARLLISLLLNTGTAIGVDLFVMRDEALKIMALEIDAKNAPIRREYDNRIAALRGLDVAPIEQKIADQGKRLDAITDSETQADTDRQKAFTDSQAQDLESERQDNGVGGRDHGHGDLAKDAERQRDLARDRVRIADAQKKELSEQQSALETQVSTMTSQLTTARNQYRNDVALLQKERDMRLLRPTDGPMTVVLGWLKLQSNSETATAVHLTTLIAWITMMTLELAFFLCRVVFKSASIYDTRINTRMRREAVQLASEFAADVAEARRRPPLRIVAANEPTPAPEAANDEPPQDNMNGR